MADLLARIDHAVAGLCPCGAEPAPGSAYCGEDCRPSHHGLDASHCAWRWSPSREESTPDEASLRYITSWSSDSPADPAPAAGAPSAQDRNRLAMRLNSQRRMLRSLGMWRWLRGWWRRGVRRLTGRRFHVLPTAVRLAVSPTAVAAALDVERHCATPLAEAAQEESDRVALRAVCNDEAMYERALAAADDRGMSVPAMLEAVVTGRYIDSGWNEASCSADVDPSDQFPVPDYTRLSHGTYQLWCSLSDETKVTALRHARDLAAVSRCSQEQALAMILATRR